MVRTYLNEPSSTVNKFWSDTEINDMLNVGIRYAHNKIKNVSRYHFTTRATFSTVSGTEYYGLPANLKDLKILSFQNTDGKERHIPRNPGPNPFAWVYGTVGGAASISTASSGPSSYWVIGNQLRILPVPDSVMTLRLYYEARVTPLTSDSDTPAFDEDYHDIAAKWAAMELKIKNEDDLSSLSGVLEKRESDMVQDLFSRLPSPYTQTRAYLQEW